MLSSTAKSDKRLIIMMLMMLNIEILNIFHKILHRISFQHVHDVGHR